MAKLFTITLLALVATASAASHADTYPAEYPMENESYDPVEFPPVGEINFQLDDADGGYLMGAYYCDVDNLIGEHEYFSIGDQCYALYGWVAKAYGFSSAEEYKGWASGACNCSYDWDFQEWSIDGLNIVNNDKICETDGCCSTTYPEGAKGFTKNVVQFVDVLASFTTSGGCDTPTEVAFCTLNMAAYSTICYSRYLTPATRTYMSPCVDVQVVWFRTCKTFALTGMPWRNYEPERYWNDLSPEQTMTTFALFYTFDKICRPYSYFFPDTAVADGGDSPAPAGGDSPASPSPAPAPADDSSAVVFYVALSFIAALLFA